MKLRRLPGAALLLALAAGLCHPPAASPVRSGTRSGLPDILLVTVDTLRADRLGAYGYGRPTSPNLDKLLEEGVRFDRARVVEPLTHPSLASMLTSLYPQDHGATRNGLRIRPGLESLPKALRERGYQTAAFVGNWTLRDKISGLAEHFDRYAEILTRRRWMGFLRAEATAEDLTGAALEWVEEQLADSSRRPFLLWVHYVEPHAPYRLQEEFAERLGIETRGKVAPADRYDTEIAFVDHHIGRLLKGVEGRVPSPLLVVFASDHGESLGEHHYWGHGRHLYEPALRIPMGIRWRGHLAPAPIAAPALNIDLTPTILGLLGLPAPSGFAGFDWTPVLRGASPPGARVTYYQAHRGAVISKHESDLARRNGLLAVAVIEGEVKEILRVDGREREVCDLRADPGEVRNMAESVPAPSPGLKQWMETVSSGLARLDELPPSPLDERSVEQLRALGYVD